MGRGETETQVKQLKVFTKVQNYSGGGEGQIPIFQNKQEVKKLVHRSSTHSAGKQLNP